MSTDNLIVADEGVPATQSIRYSSPADIDEFIAVLEKYERGELREDQFRAFRLARGVYGQRQDGVQMLRVKIPLGILSPEQLEALADVADAAPRKKGHVTTRENVQYHFLLMDQVEGLMRRLDEVGLTTREACGNTVRNVTGCAQAGLCPDEAFDTTPFGEAIVRHLLRHPAAQALPRKFKIALSGCASDCAMGAINDVGLLAHRGPDGSRRFKVLAAGGLSTLPTSGLVLHESWPAERILEVVEAVVRLFDATGNRANRNKARLKFLVRKLGVEAFLARYREVLAGVSAPAIEGVPDPDRGAIQGAWAMPPFFSPALRHFARTNVRPSRNVGRVFVTVRLPVGDMSADQMRGLARIARRAGEGSVRLTINQNLVLRDVRAEQLAWLHGELTAIGLGAADAGSSADVTSCPGADSCRLALTNSSTLAASMTEELSSRPVDGVTIKLSGCPNSCGQHHVAAIGFHGAVRKIGERAAPHYLVMVGGGIHPDGAKFGRPIGKVPARRVREAVDRLLAYAEAERDRALGETVSAFLERAPDAGLKAALGDLLDLGANAKEDDFVDFGAEVPFQVMTLDGECAA